MENVKKRRKYRKQHKKVPSANQLKALDLLQNTNMRVVDIAKLLQVTHTTIYRWREKFDNPEEQNKLLDSNDTDVILPLT